MSAFHHKDINTNDARQGVELGSVRWVLGISLFLAAIAGAVIYLMFFRI